MVRLSQGAATAVVLLLAVAAMPQASAAALPSADELCKLVGSSSELRVVYGQDPADAEIRVFDIYGVGQTTAKHLAVFGQQRSGYSPASGGGNAKLPGWRTFRLDRLKSVEDAGKSFSAEAPSTSDTRLIGEWSCTNPVVEKK